MTLLTELKLQTEPSWTDLIWLLPDFELNSILSEIQQEKNVLFHDNLYQYNVWSTSTYSFKI